MSNQLIDIKILKNVPELIFGEGSFGKLEEIIDEISHKHGFRNVAVIMDQNLRESAPFNEIGNYVGPNGSVYYFDVSGKEPHTDDIDALVKQIKEAEIPDFLIGIGGGSVLDVTKAVSVLLTNDGACESYQGWNKVKNPPVFKIGIPTLSGTGSEASRTAVVTSATKKQGINDDAARFDFLVLDPALTKTVNPQQRFFTGMDCYIHAVEAMEGTMCNEFAGAYADKARELCVKYFMEDDKNPADMMTASYLGGCSIVYSEVGICHALSYPLSFFYGYRHGMANAIVFDHLSEYYGEHVGLFKKMVEKTV
ncbi:MAG: iron-containing alcohol dehydrogenase [Nanoarchaeota archaeon]|nr:iron-containing alcohol dehydrogenase [Nanoarchaeota archaeon]